MKPTYDEKQAGASLVTCACGIQRYATYFVDWTCADCVELARRGILEQIATWIGPTHRDDEDRLSIPVSVAWLRAVRVAVRGGGQ